MVCGFQVPANPAVPAPEPHEKEKGGPADLTTMRDSSDQQHSSGPLDSRQDDQKEELPQWRLELSQRLQAIKQKRESIQKPLPAEAEIPVSPISASVQTAQAPPPAATVIDKASFIKSASKPMRKTGPAPEKSRVSSIARPCQKILQPLEPGLSARQEKANVAETKETQNLIDRAVAAKASATSPAVTKISVSHASFPAREEGKLILLSRTLSGLIDWIFIVIFTGAFVIASDLFSGVVFLDSTSLISYLALFLLIYFVYSVFFLGTGGQTLGMMITELRVVGIEKERSSLFRLLGRCLWYLFSVGGLGFGLLWGVFDRQSLCFHDRISQTRVIRVREPLGI